jgi:DNA-binding transcriptional ArsR family regulator
MPALKPRKITGHDPEVDIYAVRASASQATAFLRAIANEDRLLLLCQLTQGERCVGELELLTGITQPTLSQQLSVLRSESLVTTRREGKFVYYDLQDERVPSMLAALQVLFCKTNGQRRKG